jgi:hypothetical protein
MARPRRAALLVVLAAALAPAVPLAAQEGWNRYEQQYGQPIDVSIADLVQGFGYDGRSVRTRGDLEFGTDLQTRTYLLRDGFGNRIAIVPVPESAGAWEEVAMEYMGREVSVTGVVRSGVLSATGGNQPTVVLYFWSFTGPPEAPPKGLAAAPAATLEAIVTRPDSFDGRTVRVVGKFRGKNLYGDLPARSRLDSDDWVIKDDVWAAWVTGRKPKGDGWALDASLRRDTGKWVAVTGRVESRRGIAYLKAMKLELVAEPAAAVEPKAAPTPTPPPKLPPVVVFSLPLDGETEVLPDSVFVVQFSKDMDEDSFEDHVLLRYRGGLRPGERPFESVRLSYDGGRRALMVDPGESLRAGREVELLLLPGIRDLDGLELVPRQAPPGEVAIDTLRYRIGG